MSSKDVIVASSNAGWLGHCFKDYESLLPNAHIKGVLNLVFSADEDKRDRMVTSQSEVDAWIEKIKSLGGMKMNEKEFEKENVFGLGQPNDAFAQYFIGKSYLNPLTDPSKTSLFLANVTFEPGCRNNWHIHHASSGGGQILICTAGFGWYQEEGKPAQSLKPGDVVTIPANVKHWHGAKKDSWFSHIAIEVPGEETSNEWCEPVTDEEYNQLG